MEIKVSVIIPVYNAEQYIRRCLVSIINQTFRQFETIIINDGSTDNSQLIIDEFVDKYPEYFRCIPVENNGVANARNIGLNAAIGEFIAFVDSDDYVDDSMLELLYHKAKEETAELVIGGYIREAKCRRRIILPNKESSLSGSLKEKNEILTNISPYIWNKLFKRSLLEDNLIRFEPFKVFEDMVFTYQCLMIANRISIVELPIYHYTVGSRNSVSSSYSEKMFDVFPALKSLKGFYMENSNYSEMEEYLTFISLHHIFLRLKTPVRKSLMQSQIIFLTESFSFLDREFPNWKENRYFHQFKRADRLRYTDINFWMKQMCMNYGIKLVKSNLIKVATYLKRIASATKDH